MKYYLTLYGKPLFPVTNYYESTTDMFWHIVEVNPEDADRAERILTDHRDKARYERRGEARFAVAPIFKCEVLP